MAAALEKLWNKYLWALENGDPRTESWFLVRSPLPVTLLLAVYFLLVVAGPRLMSSREPLSLAAPLAAYNLGLVVLSGYMFYEMASVCWWCFFSKAVELLDTVFFILRKKREQISFLHVYHHGTMLFNWWAGVKYVPGGQAFFVGMLNSLVHVFMYLYCGLASLGPRLRPSLWWKRHLTILQLGQFVAIAAHSSYNLFAECPFPDGFNVAVLLYSLSLLALFLNFYQQTYLRSKQKKLA